jgi:hypothetical protein
MAVPENKEQRIKNKGAGRTENLYGGPSVAARQKRVVTAQTIA